MSTYDCLSKTLAQVASNQGPPGVTQVQADFGEFTIDFTVVDQLGCSFVALEYCTPKLQKHSPDELQVVAERLSQQISYLLEAISPIEIDKDAYIIQLRSNPPQKDDDGTQYYELVVRQTGLHLCRYAKVPGQMRETVPATVTREVFLRLAGDFEAACQ